MTMLLGLGKDEIMQIIDSQNKQLSSGCNRQLCTGDSHDAEEFGRLHEAVTPLN